MAVADIAVIPEGVTDVYDAVDRAIQVIKESGLKYEVDAMSTAVEGSLDKILELIKEIHKAMFDYGAKGVLTNLRVQESKIYPTSINEKTGKHRK
ncbi:MAG: thiamine-binding protein [Spirochaetes bacterium]|nr:MAG: thiamine-binding protein [Spirochaetota bacterium]